MPKRNIFLRLKGGGNLKLKLRGRLIIGEVEVDEAPDRTFEVPVDDRNLSPLAPTRIFEVPADDRSSTVPPADRTFEVPADDRELEA